MDTPSGERAWLLALEYIPGINLTEFSEHHREHPHGLARDDGLAFMVRLILLQKRIHTE